MKMKQVATIKDRYDLVIVGAGPAGLAAALAAWNEGARDILICERDEAAGGILNQCIHNGFGLHHFKEELTGPEYAARFVDDLGETDVELLLNTMVLSIDGDPPHAGAEAVKTNLDQVNLRDAGSDHLVIIVSRDHGYVELRARAVVLAMGCRERSRGAIGIPGSRPAGVMTAGTAQHYVNIEGYMPGRRVVILGSGDIGLIMARRMTLEGAEVLACVELMPYSGGLQRNIVQCLEDYNIPLLLSHTVTEIRGKNRVEQVVVARVDDERRVIPGTSVVYDCDCLLLSVGLLPENELTRAAEIRIDPRTRGAYVYENMETGTPGIFACGNVVHVHDLVDFVSEESLRAGRAAAIYARKRKEAETNNVDVRLTETSLETAEMIFAVHHDDQIAYTVPQNIHHDPVGAAVDIFFRVKAPLSNVEIQVYAGDRLLRKWPRLRVAPGEMERITLQRSLLNQLDGDYLTVTIAKRNAAGS